MILEGRKKRGKRELCLVDPAGIESTIYGSKLRCSAGRDDGLQLPSQDRVHRLRSFLLHRRRDVAVCVEREWH